MDGRPSRRNKAPFSKCFPHEKEKLEFSDSPGLKSVFEKLRFRDGLVWTVGLAVEIKLRFQMFPFQLRFRDGLVWTVGLTVEIKLRFQIFPFQLRFRDGLVWTVGLTVEIKLRFQLSPA